VILALVGANPALAQDFQTKTPIGQWTLYRYADDCWMRTKLANGTTLAFSTAKDYGDLYIMLENDGWDELKAGKIYTVRVRFGTLDTDKEAYGSERQGPVEPGLAMFLTGSEDAFIGRLKASDSIRITMDGRELAATSLAGSATDDAFDYLQRCTASLKGTAAA
jgi:hypothetical protein